MEIGFTGTQNGMTPAQLATLRAILNYYVPTGLHHGDCIGSDAECHTIAVELGIQVSLHPPENTSKRAFCQGVWAEWRPKPYLDRNHDIVECADTLIATPKGFGEKIRSGTWATVRYARKMGKRVVIILPDGTLA